MIYDKTKSKGAAMNYKTEELHCIYGENDIFGKLYVPRNGGKICPAIICSHGFNSKGNDMEDIAINYAEHGIIAYTFDYCGGGVRSQSSGKSVDMSIETEQDNLRHVIDMICGLPRADKTQIYLYGESQGGFVAALTSAEMPERFAGLFLIYPAFCIPDQWLSKNPDEMTEPFSFMGDMMLSKKYYDGVPRYDVYKHISAFKKPVMIYHGDCDGIVDISYAKRVRDAYEDLSLTVITGGRHGFSGDDKAFVRDSVCNYVVKQMNEKISH